MKRFLTPLLTTLFLLGLLWAGLWVATLMLAKQQIAAFAARSGGDFHYQLAETTSSPLQIGLVLADVQWRLPSGLVLVAPRLVLRLVPGRWRHYALESDQPVQLTAPIRQRQWQLTAQGLEAQLSLHNSQRWAVLDATLYQTTITRRTDNAPEAILQTAQAQLHLQQPSTPPTDHTQSSVSLAFAINDALFQPGLLRAMPQHLTALTLNGRLLGGLPDWRQRSAVEAWRGQGGTLELDALDFSWANLSGKLQSTLALDDHLQPEGAGTIQLFLDTTAPAPTDALDFNRFTAMLFSLMAQTDPKTGSKSVTLPLALQNRQLALGVFPLTKIPEIFWGQD